MKFLKKFAVLVLVLPLLFSLVSFTFTGEDVIVIRVYEVGYKNPRIVISDNNASKEVPLEKTFLNDPQGDKNMETLSKTLKDYYKQGYKIESATSTIAGSGHQINTYILVK